MSLRSLLPLGRTFEPSVERAGRFRPADPGLLPDFTRETKAETGEVPGALRGEPAVGAFAATPALRSTSSTAPAPGSAPAPVPAAAPAVSASVGRVREGGRGWRLPKWLEQLILVLMRPGNRRRSSRPVQSEFCLRAVTVAKNDLVTSDVEVVVRKPAKPAAMSASCRARLMALWWSPVARRLGRWGNRSRTS